MPRLDLEARRRVLVLRRRGYSVARIRQRLLEEHISVSSVAIYALIKKYEQLKTIVDRPRRASERKLDKEKLRVMDESLANNDELTARSLLRILQERWPEFSVSLSTIKWACKDDLGYRWRLDLSSLPMIQDRIQRARKAFFQFGSVYAFQDKLSPISSCSIVETCIANSL